MGALSVLRESLCFLPRCCWGGQAGASGAGRLRVWRARPTLQRRQTARQLAGGSPVLSSACLLLRLIAACPRCDVSLLRQAWRGGSRAATLIGDLCWHIWQPAQRPRWKAIHQPAAARLPSWHLWAASGMMGLPRGAPGLGLCVSASWKAFRG